MPSARESISLPIASFVSRRVNPSTFVVVEDDDYGEQPYIYVKIYKDHLLITDTGCNTPRSKAPSLTSLREYLETYPIPLNDHQCLNPGGRKQYIIVCSHCHYDHILGIPQFLSANPIIVASNFDTSFLLEDLPIHSLCKYIDVPTPQYTISHWASHLEYFSHSGTAFRVEFLHIPGHTPCSLAWYDIDEHYLYIGDTFYERKRNPEIPEIPDDAGQVPGLPATRKLLRGEENFLIGTVPGARLFKNVLKANHPETFQMKQLLTYPLSRGCHHLPRGRWRLDSVHGLTRSSLILCHFQEW
jgi:glyoxylase-like metal-dependent hydrolase (beta-lactamase superfamily II)